jgi:hypothetical protein
VGRMSPGVVRSEDGYRTLGRTTGIIAIATLVLLFTPVIALASAGEPPLDATGAQAKAYFENLDATWARMAMAGLTLGMIASLWFFVAFGVLLRRVEGDPPWRSAVATLSGALLAGYGLVGSSPEAAAVHAEQITSDVADYAFASGSVGLANAWIALGSFALCSGWVILSTRVLGRWMGWWLVAAGAGLVISRFFWTNDAWTLPYMAFWLWVATLGVRLLRNPNLLDPVQRGG